MNNKIIWKVVSLSIFGLLFINHFVLTSTGKDAKEIELTLTRAGQPNATIIIGKQASQPARFAARELQYHIQKISGAVLAITNDEQEVKGGRILVGESAATRALGLKNADFKAQEYLVRFLPDTLVLMGRDPAALVATAAAGVHGKPGHEEGKFGQALCFSNSMIRLYDNGFSDKEGSLEAWVKLASPAGKNAGTILRLDGGNIWTYTCVGQEPGTHKITYSTYDGKTGCSVTSGVLGEGWHHVLATHSAPDSKIELFIDGVSQGTNKYAKTTCGGAPLCVGGLYVEPEVKNAFEGLIDEIRGSRVVRKASEIDLNKPPEFDNQTAFLLHADEKEGVPLYYTDCPPGVFDEQGSCYAVYDFLEKFCGVRWYAPTELGMVFPALPTLIVKGNEIRRKPTMEYRYPDINHYGCRGMGVQLWNHATSGDQGLFYCRLKVGGLKHVGGHSFEGYYDRFWKKNPQCPEVFEGEHPEYFAQGYDEKIYAKPPQLCYTNPDLIKQVIQDARDYFDGKGLKKGAMANGNYFGLEPMDNADYCKCPNCKPLYKMPEKRDPPAGAAAWWFFSQGFSSDYWFAFVNKVAKEIKKLHPDKYIATLAYGAKCTHPSFPIESNIAVQMCFVTRYWGWSVYEGNHEKQIYQTWLDDSKQNGRPLFLWLYYCFPEFWEYFGPAKERFKVFPGFFAHTAAQQIKMFARDGIRGAYPETGGFRDPIDFYLTFKLMDDPSLDTDQVLDEFFTRYYGSAAKPMKKLYLAIEDTYSNPKYYPEIVRKQTEWQFHQTEEMAWGYLGNEQRMKEFGKLMEQAKAKAKTDIDQKRVALFEKGVWDYMVQGRKYYLEKNDPETVRQRDAYRAKMNDPETVKQREAYRDKLKAAPPPSVAIPAVPDGAGGDPLKVDWTKAPALDKWSTVTGYPTDRKISVRIAHDQKYLYLQLEDNSNPSKLFNDPGIWDGDDWEIFFSAQRDNGPYRQLGVNPSGGGAKLAYGEPSSTWISEIKIVSNSSGKDKWIVSLAFPLETLLPGGVKSGQKIYANFYRAVLAGMEGNLAWSPNFENSFHKLDRLGEFVLE